MVKLNEEIADITNSIKLKLENDELTPFMNNSTAINTETTKQKPGWTKILVFAGIAATMGSAIPTGYCVGVVNSPAAYMKSWCNEMIFKRYNYELSDTSLELLWSIVVSIFLVGGTIGSLSGAALANKYGRKGSFVLCLQLYLIGGLAFASCRFFSSVELLILGRVIVGFASGLTTACLPMYLSELAPTALRGTLGCFCALGCTAGVVIGQLFSLQMIFGTADLWHVAISFYMVLVITCLIPIRLYPESPKWLYIVQNDKSSALKVLSHLRGMDIKSECLVKEIEEMELETHEGTKAESSKEDNSSFRSVLKNPAYRLPLFIVCAYMFGQQLSGINAIFFYSVSIFRRAGLSAQAAEWANLGAGSLNLSVSIFTPYLASNYGRRPLMMFSSLCCSVCLLCFEIMFSYIDNVSWFALGSVACILLYIFFFQFGVAPIPFFIGTELFEVAPRSVAMSMGSLSLWMGSFIVAAAFPTLQILFGPLIFLLFSLTCFLMFLITKYYLPETFGRDPCDVAPLMANGFKSKVF